jgi:guanylate kinase
MNNYIFLIVGPSGSGKTTVVNRLQKELGLKVIESYTTRPPRYDGEKGHVFVSDKEFDKLENLVGFTKYDGFRYAATAEQVEENDIYVIDPAGVKYFKENYHGCKEVRVVGIWANEAYRVLRMAERGDDANDILRRLDVDRATFCEDICDVVIYNRELDETCWTLSGYIMQRKCINIHNSVWDLGWWRKK